MRRPVTIAIFACGLMLPVSVALAQEAAPPAAPPLPFSAKAAIAQVIQKPEGPPPTPRHTGIKATIKNIGHDFTHLPSRENLMWVGIGAGVAAAVHPFDDNVNTRLASEGWPHTFFLPGKYLGQTYTLVGSALTIYAVGRTRDQPKVSHLGMDLVRALAIDEAMTEAIKFSARRERPDGSNHRSFPSGHASATFAFATALERHLGWKGAVPAYLISTYVASSRLHDNRHFVSDVAFGAAIGVIAGRTVTRHGREHYDVMVAPVRGGGVAVTFVK